MAAVAEVVLATYARASRNYFCLWLGSGLHTHGKRCASGRVYWTRLVAGGGGLLYIITPVAGWRC